MLLSIFSLDQQKDLVLCGTTSIEADHGRKSRRAQGEAISPVPFEPDLSRDRAVAFTHRFRGRRDGLGEHWTIFDRRATAQIRRVKICGKTTAGRAEFLALVPGWAPLQATPPFAPFAEPTALM